MKTKLLCTFTDMHSYDAEIESIKKYYDIVFDKIFILHIDDLNSLMLTYK